MKAKLWNLWGFSILKLRNGLKFEHRANNHKKINRKLKSQHIHPHTKQTCVVNEGLDLISVELPFHPASRWGREISTLLLSLLTWDYGRVVKRCFRRPGNRRAQVGWANSTHNSHLPTFPSNSKRSRSIIRYTAPLNIMIIFDMDNYSQIPNYN